MIVCPSYQDILELTIFCIYSEGNYGKSNILIDKIWNFCHFCVQSEWKIVRRWHHQLTHLHIHIDWSRNVSWKFAKLQNFITSLFFNRFSSGFHRFVPIFFTLSSEIKLNLFWISSLSFIITITISILLTIIFIFIIMTIINFAITIIIIIFTVNTNNNITGSYNVYSAFLVWDTTQSTYNVLLPLSSVVSSWQLYH